MKPPFDWRHFLYLADDLAGYPDKSYCAEANERTAISRAYYAAYNLAFAHIKAVDEGYFRTIRSNRQVKHGDVSAWFDARPKSEKALRKVGANLVRLCSDRHAADYDLRLKDDNELPLKCVTLASKVVKILVAQHP